MSKLIKSAFYVLCTLLSLTPGDAAPVLQGRLETETAAPKEHCTCINPNKVNAVQQGSSWQLVDDGQLLLSMPTSESATDAVKMIRFYGMTELCTVGSSQGANKNEMVYFKAREESPVGSMSDEDAIAFDTSGVKVEQRNGRWKVTSTGDLWLLDFDQDKEAAENAAEIIRHYGFDKQCFVGKPARQLQYWHK